MLDLFFTQINTLLDEHAPIHKLSKKSYHLRRNLRSAKALNHLSENPTDFSQQKFYCQETNPTVKLTKHNDYKRIRNIVVCKIKESKKLHDQNYFQRNSKNLKKTWDDIESVVTLKSKAKPSPKSLFVDRNII